VRNRTIVVGVYFFPAGWICHGLFVTHFMADLTFDFVVLIVGTLDVRKKGVLSFEFMHQSNFFDQIT